MTYQVNKREDFTELAKRLALGASDLINELKKRTFSISTKSTSNDMVTEIDKASEEYLVNEILKLRPNDSIIGEEGANYRGSTDISWVIDPIDGTTNFIYDFPSYSVSIGVKEGETTIAGAVFNLPESSMYEAGKGTGSYKNSKPIRVRSQVTPENSLIATGFGYSPTRRKAQARFLSEIIGEIRDIRRAGAASLDLCYLAEGRIDGYYEGGLWAWDFTAGALIVREAGGVVIGADQDEPSQEITIAASNAQLANFLRAKLQSALPFIE